MTKIKTKCGTALAIVLAMHSHTVNACTICQDVGQYGTSVSESVTSAGDSVLSTTKNLAKNYSDTARALVETSDSIVSAINASSNTVSMELIRTGETRARLLEALKQSFEQLEKSKLIAETNKQVAETYGEENIPVELCEAFGRSEDRQLAQITAERLVKKNETRQIEERSNENRTPVIDPYTSNAVSLSGKEFTEVEAKIAMEQASILSGERAFPVSPDVVMNIATRGGSGSDEAMQVMSSWMRASNASQEIATQIAKKTKPTKEEQSTTESISVYGDLWLDVKNGMEQEAAIRDGSASNAALLRTIARRGSVNNRIKLEQLETQLAIARMNSSQLGYLNEEAMNKLKPYLKSQAASTAIERTDD